MTLTFAKSAQNSTTSPSNPSSAGSSNTTKPKVDFLKKGKAARQAEAEDKAKAEQQKAAYGKMFRFRLAQEEEAKITFLDGDLDDDGFLDVPAFHEHQINLSGKYPTFLCTLETDGECPLCNADEKPYLAHVFTVLDHREYTDRNGVVHQHTKKLFVAKRQTFAVLSKLAVKRGGLSGCTFDVMRTGDKSASVGTQFDFVEKNNFNDIASACGLQTSDVSPAVYEDELVYHSASELSAMNVGKPVTGPGYTNNTSSNEDLASHL